MSDDFEDLDIEWVAPPVKVNRRPYKKIAQTLTEHPDTWARVAHNVPASHPARWRTTLRNYDRKLIVSQRIVEGKEGQASALYDVYAMYRTKEDQ